MASSNEVRHRLSDKTASNKQDDNNSVQDNRTYKNAREYAQALRPWLCWYHQTNAMQSMSRNMFSQMQQLSYFSAALVNFPQQPPTSTSEQQQRFPNPDPYASRRPPNYFNGQAGAQNGIPPPPNGNGHQNASASQSNLNQQNEGVRMKIPTFWKRVAAELIDFTFLFYIKMIISISLVSEFNMDYLSVVSGEDFMERLNDLDYDRVFAITFEVIALEIINRVLITIFETMCLCRARARGRTTGATPGKRLMGLRVVSCDSIRPLGNGYVRVSPAGLISVKNAFLRSAIKNFTIAFFLPACLTLFFFKHNRAAYDVVAHTVVVEDAA